MPHLVVRSELPSRPCLFVQVLAVLVVVVVVVVVVGWSPSLLAGDKDLKRELGRPVMDSSPRCANKGKNSFNR
ncbi:unnamed protein product [Gadus morhua 'NCC']